MCLSFLSRFHIYGMLYDISPSLVWLTLFSMTISRSLHDTNELTKKKETHRLREWIYDSWEEEEGKGKRRGRRSCFYQSNSVFTGYCLSLGPPRSKLCDDLSRSGLFGRGFQEAGDAALPAPLYSTPPITLSPALLGRLQSISLLQYLSCLDHPTWAELPSGFLPTGVVG